ncbi:ABC-type Fe3+/spermidine/putrescine transport system ATPase subunit [Flavobacterium croceum DSM 17960]|uniref:ABC-type Fe3+/spermidine/putrescine transport system ATPase subunit n=2 Tax=Flavobacterium TaxID=237 RepID=A0A2S4N6L2_9FLAO|nr:ABC-type Fe3+/spermidine/putrescine transport system ATPase subunit [Flavobacterium croceum DSM 17960]
MKSLKVIFALRLFVLTIHKILKCFILNKNIMLKVTDISFSYQERPIINTISFTVDKGKTVAIIGESGCGKSTLLKLIYGLYDLNHGQIFWNDNEVLGPKYHLIPGMEYMKYLAQDFDLMPYITVAENVGKYLSNFFPEEKQKRITELLEVVEMSDFAQIKAQYLSGGQMQRVALAKVLAKEPEVLLLDEPFSHIDNFRKNSLRRNIFSYLKEKQITTIIATHDSTDMLSFTDEVIVLKQGEIIVKDTPKKVYQNPINYYTASLFGDVNTIYVREKPTYLYPNQFQIIDQSPIEAVVKNCYYRGKDYLLELLSDDVVLFVESQKEYALNSKVCIALKK